MGIVPLEYTIYIWNNNMQLLIRSQHFSYLLFDTLYMYTFKSMQNNTEALSHILHYKRYTRARWK